MVPRRNDGIHFTPRGSEALSPKKNAASTIFPPGRGLAAGFSNFAGQAELFTGQALRKS